MLSSGVRASATEHDDLRTLQGDNLVTSSQNPARSTLWPPDGRLHVLGKENTTSDPERRHRQRGRATLGSAVSVSYSGDLTAYLQTTSRTRESRKDTQAWRAKQCVREWGAGVCTAIRPVRAEQGVGQQHPSQIRKSHNRGTCQRKFALQQNSLGQRETSLLIRRIDLWLRAIHPPA